MEFSTMKAAAIAVIILLMIVNVLEKKIIRGFRHFKGKKYPEIPATPHPGADNHT